ncbi:hypothetical protein CRG98_049051, partial [Punica granatum]
MDAGVLVTGTGALGDERWWRWVTSTGGAGDRHGRA